MFVAVVVAVVVFIVVIVVLCGGGGCGMFVFTTDAIVGSIVVIQTGGVVTVTVDIVVTAIGVVSSCEAGGLVALEDVTAIVLLDA